MLIYSVISAFHSSFTSSSSSFNEKKDACILYELRAAELCAVQKATGLSGDPEQKAELGHSLHLLSRREGERGGEVDRGWRVGTPQAQRGRAERNSAETTATGDRMGSSSGEEQTARSLDHVLITDRTTLFDLPPPTLPSPLKPSPLISRHMQSCIVM